MTLREYIRDHDEDDQVLVSVRDLRAILEDIERAHAQFIELRAMREGDLRRAGFLED